MASRVASVAGRSRRWPAAVLTAVALCAFAEPCLAPFFPPPPPKVRLPPPSGVTRFTFPEGGPSFAVRARDLALFNELTPTQQRLEAYRKSPTARAEADAARATVAAAATRAGSTEDAVRAFLVAELVPPESARAVAARALGLPPTAPELSSAARAALAPLTRGEAPALRQAAGIVG